MPVERPAVERVHPPDALMSVVNPVMRRVLTSPLHRAVSAHVILLRYTGRRTGRRIELPVGRQEVEGRLATFTNSRWRHNFRGGHDAELVVEGSARAVRGVLRDDVDAVTAIYAEKVAALGWRAAQRRLGLRINVQRAPTRAELAEAIGASGLSVVVFDPR